MPVTSAISVSTIISSMSVTPDRLRVFVAPTDNVGVVPFSAGLAVGAERNEVGLVSVVTGEFVEIGMAPGVFRRVLRQIRTRPLIHAVRFHAQRVQAQISGGKIPGIQF